MTTTPPTRHQLFNQLFANQPAWRFKQLQQAFYTPNLSGWSDVSTLPGAMRQTLSEKMPWLSLSIDTVKTNRDNDTYKALLKTVDDLKIESVLMKNARGSWTICVSSQVGCAMKCVFCATGQMGLKRSLNSDEIADQYRLWRDFLAKNFSDDQRISNVVFMGMGEPLANYEAVKETIKTWLDYTDLGHTHITVSSVGLLPQLEKLLDDNDWPPVRVAISLHSADETLRKKIVPTSAPEFLPQLGDWIKKFLDKNNRRRNHLTFEYIMLRGVNDTPQAAKQLADFTNRLGKIKINLIPYNSINTPGLDKSADVTIEKFKKVLRDCGVLVTQRQTMGDDINAACGQLANKS